MRTAREKAQASFFPVLASRYCSALGGFLSFAKANVNDWASAMLDTASGSRVWPLTGRPNRMHERPVEAEWLLTCYLIY